MVEMVDGPHQNSRFQPVRFAGLPDLHQDQRRVAAECSFGANGNELDGQSYAVNQSTSNSINQSIHPSINHFEFKRFNKTPTPNLPIKLRLVLSVSYICFLAVAGVQLEQLKEV